MRKVGAKGAPKKKDFAQKDRRGRVNSVNKTPLKTHPQKIFHLQEEFLNLLKATLKVMGGGSVNKFGKLLEEIGNKKTF
jgi:hypothetical protein